MLAGGAVATYRPPAPRVRSYLQHFAAGLVFAAAAVEVLPDVMHRRAPIAASIGFACGVALMLAIRALAGGSGKGEQGEQKSSDWSMAAIVGIDIFIDGILIGVMLSTGQKAGVLVTIALAVELLTLGLATAADMGKGGSSRARILTTIAVLAALPLAGAIGGSLLLSGLQGGWMEAVLAFAVAALLYLAAEELLVEAHEVPETPLTTATFFAGFLLLLIVDMVG
jgi:ZIP family zinc transporter